jgi:hypothetical protein
MKSDSPEMQEVLQSQRQANKFFKFISKIMQNGELKGVAL